MKPSRVDLSHTEPACYSRRFQAQGDLGAVTELAVAVATPAERSVFRCYAAGMRPEMRPCDYLAEPARPCHSSGDESASGCAVAKLAVLVVTPAERKVVGGDAAGVSRTRFHLSELARAADRSRRRAIGGRAIAELPAFIRAPAVGLVARSDTAGMRGARADLAELEATGYQRWDEFG